MKAVYFLSCALLLITLSGCGSYNKSISDIQGHSEVTVDGVVYLQFPSGATVKYDKNGKVCTKIEMREHDFDKRTSRMEKYLKGLKD
jgi:uncharacterized protein YceK